ncbi:hypothetical protein D3Z52_00465 [Clostridiaceae bacterium]|nr:hypothetical protein [Clostridiaceae bacterium]NBI81181.1 hypothetical protein [Clostridiaceae bacterium]RKJ83014.1 hypothetical protein D7X33_00740 [Butyricicoccus sp. 1XD8-22]
MRFNRNCPVCILMLGAGGTGGHIAPHLYRLFYALERPTRFILSDGDIVEQKNLVRQNFCEADLGKNKAQVLAERYAGAFGLEAEYIPDFIESSERLAELLTSPPKMRRQLTILIGAVDNNRSRQLCHEVFYRSRDLIYIDSGNGEFSGQVVCGVRQSNRTVSKPLARYYPDVMEVTDRFPTELSCAEASVSSPQAITANLTAATAVVDMLYNILVLGELNTKMVTFSTKSVNVRPNSAGRKAA